MSSSQKHEYSILLKGTTREEVFPIILKYFKRKLRIQQSQAPHSITLKIGSDLNYLGGKVGPQLVGTIRILLGSDNRATQLKVIYNFKKFIQIPSVYPLALIIFLFLLVIINRGINLLQSLAILLIYIPFWAFEQSNKFKLVKEIENEVIRDLRRFLKKSFGAERISE